MNKTVGDLNLLIERFEIVNLLTLMFIMQSFKVHNAMNW